MSHDTSDFDSWLERAETRTRGLRLVPALDAVSELAREAFGARIWFVEMPGPRWSHIAGQGCDDAPESDVCCIPLNDRIGLAWDTWGSLSQGAHRAELVASVRRLVASEGAPQ